MTAVTFPPIDLGEHGLCYITVPENFDENASAIPMILYAHGAGGVPNQFATLPYWQQMRDWCDAAGWIVVEGTGGGDKSWSNSAAQAAYLAYLDLAESLYDIGSKVLLGRSMGGWVTAWLYAMSPRAGDFDGWINNSGVTAALVGTADLPRNSADNTTFYFGENLGELWAAWGVSSYSTPEEGYAAASAAITSAGMAPESWPANVWTGKLILCCYGTADTTVPWTTRGAGPMMTIWDGHANVTTSPKVGGDHTGANGSYTDIAAMGAFLSQFPGSTPVPPVDKTITLIKARFIKLEDGFHRIHPVLTT